MAGTDIKKKLEKDALAKLLGVEILEVREGYAKTRVKVSKDLLNSLNTTHGAAIFAVADMALAAASNSYGQTAVALNVNITYLRATGEGTVLYATAEEENLTARTGLYRIVIRDEEGCKVAVAEGLVYRKK
ncbi:hotdog fold thioesterase [Calderihabitans maritimus]|uniref:Thioesterase domain-containing protein n=1 Tax=Calderihabitans maritimus TaxID=1246530 RepID=A0A1Z5HPV9_9FIRM|nr:hotdog fold thioesterase [Calderihabitans maritimus]GAW91572.1 hypothetical protein Desgi_2410 [Calderihabitans maritimus]